MKKRYMIGIGILGVFVGLGLFLNYHPVFGGNSKVFNSPNYKNGKFQNIDGEISVETSEDGMASAMKEFFFGGSDERVPKLIETVEFKREDLKENSFVWLGHSTILMNLGGKVVITDPVFFEASPIFIGGKPFKYSNTPEIEDLPEIDTVLISHDHYDHLDYKAIEKLDKKVKKYLVPLGVKAHLLKWGIDNKKIEEFDWYDSYKNEGLDFVFTPAQHFSGRGLTNRNSTLWGSWVAKSDNLNVYFSGDSGYFSGFKTIGEKYGPFDFAFIENGAYNKNWKTIHMMPEESVKAGLDLKANSVMPIHWGKFDLSLHSWYEPIERFSKEAKLKSLNYFHPKVGEVFDKENKPKETWWKKDEKN